MPRIIWLASAIDDLERLRAFIAGENSEAAKRAAKSIQNAAMRLEDFPLAGKPINYLPEYRDLVCRFGTGGYVLRYRIYADAIYIVHIRHCREFDFNKIRSSSRGPVE